MRVLREPSVTVVAYQERVGEVVYGPAPTKMLIHLEGAQAFCVSIFGGVEHLRGFAPQSFDTEVSNFAPSGRSGVGGTQSSQLPLLE